MSQQESSSKGFVHVQAGPPLPAAKLKIKLAVGLGLALALTTVSSAAANHHLTDGASVNLISRQSGKCADVVSASTADAADVAQYDCNGGSNQMWRIQDLGNGYVRLAGRHSGKCLDVPGGSTAKGERLQQWGLNLVSNPALPGLFADPNIVVFDGVFYLYPTTDGFASWSGTQYRAFSSTDLVNWTDHGVILDVAADVSWADNSAWAPGIAERNGK